MQTPNDQEMTLPEPWTEEHIEHLDKTQISTALMLTTLMMIEHKPGEETFSEDLSKEGEVDRFQQEIAQFAESKHINWTGLAEDTIDPKAKEIFEHILKNWQEDVKTSCDRALEADEDQVFVPVFAWPILFAISGKYFPKIVGGVLTLNLLLLIEKGVPSARIELDVFRDIIDKPGLYRHLLKTHDRLDLTMIFKTPKE